MCVSLRLCYQILEKKLGCNSAATGLQVFLRVFFFFLKGAYRKKGWGLDKFKYNFGGRGGLGFENKLFRPFSTSEKLCFSSSP